MSQMKFVLPFVFVLLFGCAHNKDAIRMDTVGHLKPGATGRLTVGMAKDEVISLFGPPESVSATTEGQLMIYVEERPWWNWVKIGVVVSDGRVVSFGDNRVPTVNRGDSQKINQVSVGMTKQQVIDLIGSPSSTSAKDGVEYLTYNLDEIGGQKQVPFYVRLTGGKVDSYGKRGDFDSTQIPTTRLIIENK